MKHILLFITALCAFSVTLNAQEISDHTLGLRLGDSDGFGAEITYQKALQANNRLEANLGWRSGRNFNGFKLAGLYQWVWQLDGDFNWYAGAGGGLSSFSIDVPGERSVTDTFIFVAGDIGIEYNFDIPLLLSLDFRPEIGFGDSAFDNNDLGFDIALSIRYQF